jgi:hypothetical protein
VQAAPDANFLVVRFGRCLSELNDHIHIGGWIGGVEILGDFWVFGEDQRRSQQ